MRTYAHLHQGPHSVALAHLSGTSLSLPEQCLGEAVPQCLVVVDRDGDIVFANGESERLFGRPAQEVVGGPIEFLICERQRDQYARQLQRFIDSEPILPRRFEICACDEKGRDFPVEIRLGLLKKTRDTLVLNLIRDLSERQHLREQLRQSQKLEPIALLAGAVAHDFNDLLTIINGCSEVLLKNPQLDDGSRVLLQDIVKAGERGAGLTRRLLNFNRKSPLQPRRHNINVVIADLAKILCRLLGPNIAVSTLLHPQLGEVYADECQIEQVVLNLAVNARDAMPHGGKLTLETANVAEQDRELHDVGLRPGPYVMLTVTDTGCGMDEKTRVRIFEPFFTTKEPGHGTGLGLSTVAGIINGSGGRITVATQPGRGTTFRILLPRAQDILPLRPHESDSAAP